MFKAKKHMTQNPICVKEDTPVRDVVKILVDKNITGVPVVDDEMMLLGVVSEKDLLDMLYEHGPSNKTVKDVMTANVTSFDEEDSLIDICDCLINNHFRRVPITSGRKLVGLVSRRDIMRLILHLQKEE